MTGSAEPPRKPTLIYKKSPEHFVPGSFFCQNLFRHLKIRDGMLPLQPVRSFMSTYSRPLCMKKRTGPNAVVPGLCVCMIYSKSAIISPAFGLSGPGLPRSGQAFPTPSYITGAPQERSSSAQRRSEGELTLQRAGFCSYLTLLSVFVSVRCPSSLTEAAGGRKPVRSPGGPCGTGSP